MYCPRCNRSISDDQITAKNELLKNKFGLKSLEEGSCPVCGTKLISTQKK